MSTPESTFYVTGGTLRQDAACYVERQADKDLLDGLLKGEFCYVLTSRQMGKSSLMVRTAGKLREQGVQVVVLDLTAIGQNLTPEQWYDGLLVRLGRQLDLEDELDVFWEAHRQLGPCQRLFSALRDVVLGSAPVPGAVSGVPPDTSSGDPLRTGKQNTSKDPPSETSGDATGTVALPKRLVLFVDELDVVRSLPFSTDEFFAAIRECYNRRVEDAEFNRLTFCLLGVASPSDLIRDTRTTPFNIGRRIVLNDFTEAEAAPLAGGLNVQLSALNSRRLLERILYWTNGHPYLTQRLCQALAQELAGAPGGGDGPGKHTVDRLSDALFLSRRAREQDDNLLFVRERLLRSDADMAGLLQLYERVWQGRAVPDDETNPLVSVLKLSGVVRVPGDRLCVRNRLYAGAFDRDWVRTHMPDAELRRQRAAFQKGMIRATAVSLVVLVAMGGLVLYTMRLAEGSQAASARALLAQARAIRTTARAGQRFESLDALARAAAIQFTPELRDEAIASLALPDVRLVRQSPGTAAKTVALAPDGQRFARANTNGSISIRSVVDDHELSSVPDVGGAVRRMVFSESGRWLTVIHEGSNSCGVWDLEQRQAVLTLPGPVTAAAFSPDGQRVALARQGAVAYHALSSGAQIQSFEVTGAPTSMAFSPDGLLLGVASQGSSLVRLLDAESGQVAHDLPHRGVVNALVWQRQGAWLASACQDWQVYLWDPLSGAQVATLTGHEGEPRGLAVNSRGDLLASAGADDTVRLWRVDPPRQLLVVGGLENPFDPRFSVGGRHLALCNALSSVKLYELADAAECRLFHGHPQVMKGPHRVDISADGRIMASAGTDGVQLWDLARGRKLDFMRLGPTAAAFFDAAGLYAAELHGLHFWPLANTTADGVDTWQLGPARGVIRTTELDAVAKAATNETIALLQGKRLFVLTAATNGFEQRPAPAPLKTLACSADGRWVAAGAANVAKVFIWLRGQTNIAAELPIGPGAEVAFTPNSEWLVTGTDAEYRYWRARNWQPGLSVARTSGVDQPAAMAFSRDGRLMALARSRMVIDLVQPGEDRVLASLTPPEPKRISWLCFSPDARHLAVATEAHFIHVWDLARLREELAALKLAGNWPAWGSEPTAPPTNSVRLIVQVGELEHGPSGAESSVASRSGSVESSGGSSRSTHAARVLRYTAAIEAAPNVASNYMERGQSHHRLWQMEEALRDFSRVIELQPTNAQAYMQRGNVYADLNRLPEAFADFAQMPRVAPEPGTAYGWRAVSLFFLERYEEALADVDRAIALSPKSALNQFNRAVLCERLNRWPERLAALNRAVELAPTNVTFLQARGEALWEQERYVESLADYNRVSELSGDDPHVTERYAERLARVPDPWFQPAAALAAIERARIQAATGHSHLIEPLQYHAGRVHLRQGDFAQALEAFNSAAAQHALTDTNPPAEVSFFRAMARHQMKQSEQADLHYKQALVSIGEDDLRQLYLLRDRQSSSHWPDLWTEVDAVLGRTDRARLLQATGEKLFGRREAETSPALIDLGPHYNTTFDDGLDGPEGATNNLAGLSRRVQRLGGIEFDARGILRLGSLNAVRNGVAESRVVGIAIGRKCRRLHFLHAAVESRFLTNGTAFAQYVAHYVDGREQAVPVVQGENVLDWWAREGDPGQPSHAVVAWVGTNSATTLRSTREGLSNQLRLFRFTWENPWPDTEVRSLDFLSLLTAATPLLVAITAE